MGIRKWLGGRGSRDDEEPVSEYTLTMMQPGFLVDHDLKTWQVAARKLYDYDGFIATEWELHAGDDVRFLERSEDDGKVELTLTRSISIRRDFDEDVVGTILEEDDPPEVVHFESRSFVAVESSTGVQRAVVGEAKGGDPAAEDDLSAASDRDFVSWSYETEDNRVLFVLRWGERDFSAYEGEHVEEYQFTDILPGTLQ